MFIRKRWDRAPKGQYEGNLFRYYYTRAGPEKITLKPALGRFDRMPVGLDALTIIRQSGRQNFPRQ